MGDSATITAAVSTNGILGPNGHLTDLSAFGEVLNFINLMTYDYFGSWSSTTGPNAPMNGCGQGPSIQDAVNTWVNAGFPKSKVLLGLGAYAHGFTTQSNTLTTTQNPDGSSSQLYQPKQSSPSGSNLCGGASGDCNYTDMIKSGIIAQDGSAIAPFVRYYDTCSQTPFVFNPNTKEFLAYDDAQSISAKVLYAKNAGLGGVLVDFTRIAVTEY